MSFLCVVLKCKEINWEEKWWKDSCWDGCSFLLFLGFGENLGTSAENINRITTVLHNLDGLDISSLKIRFWNMKNVSQGIDNNQFWNYWDYFAYLDKNHEIQRFLGG